MYNLEWRGRQEIYYANDVYLLDCAIAYTITVFPWKQHALRWYSTPFIISYIGAHFRKLCTQLLITRAILIDDCDLRCRQHNPNIVFVDLKIGLKTLREKICSKM